MSAYFKLRCFQPETTKKILIVGNIIVAILGIVHWICIFFKNLDCGIIGEFLRYFLKHCEKIGTAETFVSYDQYKKLLDSPMAYYAITGIQQILTSALVIAIILGYLGTSSKHLWARLLTILLLFQFAFNFVIAVSSSMAVTYYN
jgi:hypothetical protein